MTDNDMALRLGEYINSLLEEIAALKGVFLEYRIETPAGRREIPVEEMKKRVSLEAGFREVCDAQRRGLLQAIEHETQASALIRSLCRHYFPG
jgi:hypothetical protein